MRTLIIIGLIILFLFISWFLIFREEDYRERTKEELIRMEHALRDYYHEMKGGIYDFLVERKENLQEEIQKEREVLMKEARELGSNIWEGLMSIFLDKNKENEDEEEREDDLTKRERETILRII